jgi:hypothetical protein
MQSTWDMPTSCSIIHSRTSCTTQAHSLLLLLLLQLLMLASAVMQLQYTVRRMRHWYTLWPPVQVQPSCHELAHHPTLQQQQQQQQSTIPASPLVLLLLLPRQHAVQLLAGPTAARLLPSTAAAATELVQGAQHELCALLVPAQQHCQAVQGR